MTFPLMPCFTPASLQLLLLWDRIIGYDSLEFLPILCAGIVLFRSGGILAATTPEGVR